MAHRIQSLGQVFCSVLVRDMPVSGMVYKELLFAFKGVSHALLGVDISLTSVHDAYKSKFQGINATGENVQRIRARVHEVEFGEDTDGSPALWINGTCQFKGLGVGEIDIGG
jgi:hypothetical protein